MAQCLLEDSLGDLIIDPADTYRALSSLDPSKTKGIDGISPKVLKFCACAICESRSLTCFSSVSIKDTYLRNGSFMYLLRSLNQGTGLRFVTTGQYLFISKVLEKLVYDHIISFLSNSVINASQFGFLKENQRFSNYWCFWEETRKDDQVDSV